VGRGHLADHKKQWSALQSGGLLRGNQTGVAADGVEYRVGENKVLVFPRRHRSLDISYGGLIVAGTCKTPDAGAPSGNVTCTLNSLGSGIGFTVSMVVDVTYKSGKTLTDTANASSPVFDPTATNNSATATTAVN
jgi:hypothetical protein